MTLLQWVARLAPVPGRHPRTDFIQYMPCRPIRKPRVRCARSRRRGRAA